MLIEPSAATLVSMAPEIVPSLVAVLLTIAERAKEGDTGENRESAQDGSQTRPVRAGEGDGDDG